MLDINKIFPSDLASNKEKTSPEFGEKVAQAIETQWWSGNLSARRAWIELMRAYSRGEQDVQQYKDTIEGQRAKKKSADGNDVNVKTHKIDYKILKVMPNFKNIVINAIDESLFKPRAEAIDITAVDKKKEYFKKLDNDFYTKEFAQIISQGIGMDITNPNVPETEDQLKIKKLEYKPKIEVANELAIENVLKLEKFESTKDKIDKDLFDLGVGVGRHYTDYSEGIKIKYVDPYNWIHNDFEMENGSDIRYHGIVEKGTVADIEKEGGRILSQEERDELKRTSLGINEEFSPYTNDGDGHRVFEYMSFVYLTRKERIYKKYHKNGRLKVIDRSKNGYNPSIENKKITVPYKVWFEGVYVIGARILVKWEEVPNQIESEIGNPISPFLVYAPNIKNLSEKGYIRFDSLVERAIPIVDDIHRDWYKFQQLKMETRPATIEIDTDAINEVSLNGQPIAANDILDLFFGRGLLLKRRYNEEGEEIDRAVQEQNGGLTSDALTFLSNEFANNYQRLRQLIGVNELRDGTTTPNSKTAVTVQKLLLASSNNATNHIVKASFALSLAFCESVSYRLYDVLKTEPLKERYISAIGTDNVEILDEIKELPAHKFAIYFDFKPDNEERLAFEQSLITSYTNGEINVAQYNQARHIRNTKSAVKYLEYCVLENDKKKQAEKIQIVKAQAEAQAQTSILSEKAKQETVTIEWQTKEQEILLKSKFEDESKRKQALIKDALDAQKHIRDMEKLQMELQIRQGVENFKEDRKDARVNLKDTNESKKIFQRKNNTEPIDFENQLNSIFNNNSLN